MKRGKPHRNVTFHGPAIIISDFKHKIILYAQNNFIPKIWCPFWKKTKVNNAWLTEQRSILLVVRIHQRSKRIAEMSKESKEMYSQGQQVSRQVSKRRKSERAKALIYSYVFYTLLNNLAESGWAKTVSDVLPTTYEWKIFTRQTCNGEIRSLHLCHMLKFLFIVTQM